MLAQIQNVAVKISVALMLGVALFGTSVIPGASAHASSQRVTSDASAKTQRYERKVYLHGTQPATSICLAQDKPTQGVTPKTVTGDCNDSHLLRLYLNNNYGGPSICFFGTGFVNLTDYIWYWPYTWNDQLTSFKSGSMTGRFFWDINGGGYVFYFYQGTNDSYIGNTWNDQASSLAIEGCNGYC